ERRRDRARAGRFWKQVEGIALKELDRPGAALDDADHIEYVWKLADSYRFRGQPGPAIKRLEPLLPIHDRLGDKPGKRDTLRRLAGHHASRREFAQAEKYLRQALDLHDGLADADKLLGAGLAEELADAVTGQGKGRDVEARHWNTRAALDYQAVLK